uniref:Uncharacterized protein n=1 Tax=Anguilla anguilla TaxID=7936 RepID=A0A0E9XLU9_ANGAN
MEELKRPLSKR